MKVKEQNDWEELERFEQKRIRRAPHKRHRQENKAIIQTELENLGYRK